jgi:hypothetical protein
LLGRPGNGGPGDAGDFGQSVVGSTFYLKANGTENCSGAAPGAGAGAGAGNADALRRDSKAVRSSDGNPVLADILAETRLPSAATENVNTATPGSETPFGLKRSMRLQPSRAYARTEPLLR